MCDKCHKKRSHGKEKLLYFCVTMKQDPGHKKDLA